MMLTRCPACQTVFRLRPEQLHARQGEVRCGHCFHPFNAREHALGPQQDMPPPASAPADFLRLEDRPAPTSMSASSASMLEFGIPEFEQSGSNEAETGPAEAKPDPLPGGTPTYETPAAEALAAGAGSAPLAASDAPARHPGGDFVAPPSDDMTGRADDTDTAPARPFPGVLRSGRRPPSAPEPQAAGSPAQQPEHTQESATPEPPAPAIAVSAEDDAPPHERPAADTVGTRPDLARLDATYGRPPKRMHPALAAIGSVFVIALIMLLGTQALYLYRMEIARELPGLRPLLTEACERAGCTVPYPQDADRLAIEASDLQAEPGRPGHYLLHATLNNRAEYPQQWPHVELTLTDAGDNPVSRRVLSPEDWLPASEIAEAFPARKATEIRLPFQVEGQAPTGYRIYAFYP